MQQLCRVQKMAPATVDRRRCCIGHPLLGRLGARLQRVLQRIWKVEVQTRAVKSLPQGLVDGSLVSGPPSLQVNTYLTRKNLTLRSYLLDFSLHIWNGYRGIDGTKQGNDDVRDSRAGHPICDSKCTSVRWGFFFPASTAYTNIAQFNMSSLFVLGMVCTRVSKSQVCSDRFVQKILSCHCHVSPCKILFFTWL